MRGKFEGQPNNFTQFKCMVMHLKQAAVATATVLATGSSCNTTTRNRHKLSSF